MAVKVEVVYEGDLHCTAVHGPSGSRITTDAPTDNHGRGELFSPTDLVAAAIGTCVLTIMAIAARSRGFDIPGARTEVIKEMGKEPKRHIAKLTVAITLPASLDAKQRTLMEAAAHGCPVHASLGLTKVDLSFSYV